VFTLFFVTQEQLTQGEIEVSGSEGRHAVSVLRIKEGEVIRLADGEGNWGEGEVKSISKDKFSISVAMRGSDRINKPSITVAQAVLKSENQKAALDQLVQAGVDMILPWRATRSVGASDKREKWQDVIYAAAKQSRRSRIPKVSSMISLQDLAGQVVNYEKSIVLHEGATEKMTNVLHGENLEKLLVIVGPEGGLTHDELAVLESAGAKPVRLGDPVIRADLAGALALAAITAFTGNW
jgi:16S rRNA (uracil1498-N3)-methyltransferase